MFGDTKFKVEETIVGVCKLVDKKLDGTPADMEGLPELLHALADLTKSINF